MSPYDWQRYSRVPVPQSDHRQTLFDARKGAPFPFITLSIAVVMIVAGIVMIIGRP